MKIVSRFVSFSQWKPNDGPQLGSPKLIHAFKNCTKTWWKGCYTFDPFMFHQSPYCTFWYVICYTTISYVLKYILTKSSCLPLCNLQVTVVTTVYVTIGCHNTHAQFLPEKCRKWLLQFICGSLRIRNGL